MPYCAFASRNDFSVAFHSVKCVVVVVVPSRSDRLIAIERCVNRKVIVVLTSNLPFVWIEWNRTVVIEWDFCQSVHLTQSLKSHQCGMAIIKCCRLWFMAKPSMESTSVVFGYRCHSVIRRLVVVVFTKYGKHKQQIFIKIRKQLYSITSHYHYLIYWLWLCVHKYFFDLFSFCYFIRTCVGCVCTLYWLVGTSWATISLSKQSAN